MGNSFQGKYSRRLRLRRRRQYSAMNRMDGNLRLRLWLNRDDDSVDDDPDHGSRGEWVKLDGSKNKVPSHIPALTSKGPGVSHLLDVGMVPFDTK